MVQILGKVAMRDLAAFISVFATRGAAMRRKHGCQSACVYQVAEQVNSLVLLFTWESRERFEAFLADPEVKETMKSGGTIAPPEFTFLQEVGRFPN